jgi:hypothetical protein
MALSTHMLFHSSSLHLGALSYHKLITTVDKYALNIRTEIECKI